MPSAPPEGFEVEFLSSSSSVASSAVPSRATSRGASPSSEAAAIEEIDAEHAPADASDAGDSKPTVSSDTAGALGVTTSEDQPVPLTFAHGAELTASAASMAELDDELTRCALLLFDGRLPQQPPPPGQAEAPRRRWPEAVNYHRAVLLGYDDAGFAYMDAQAFAQRVPPPQGWRLCPLPLLVCAVAKLAHFYRGAESDDTTSEQSTAAGASGAALRYPVLPRPARTAAAGGSGGLENAQSSRDGITGATLPSPSYPAPASGEPSPSTSSATTPPVPPSTSPAYLSPPLRWSLPMCGHAPSLNLQQLFRVQPNRVYQLARPPEEVVFLGVAFGIPWIRPVVLATATAPDAAPPQVETCRDVVLHATDPSTSSSASQPPAGYRWKDTRAWAVPLIGCHDACDIRGRHGLVDPPPGATGVSPAAAVADAEGSAPPSALSSAATGAPPEKSWQETSLRPSEADEQNSGTPAPLSLSPPSPSPKPLTAAALLFVKEGTRVFVPGRFGVMLECNTNSALMEAHFGVVHGDQLVPRALSSHAAAAQLSGAPKPGKTTTPSLPPGPFIVMGLYGRNVLVLIADGEGQTAVQIHVTRGVAEVAEAFRKVAGAPLPPPALPLEPLSVPASPPEPTMVAEAAAAASRLVAKDEVSQERLQAPETERREDQAGPVPGAVTCIVAEGTDAFMAPAADTAAAAAEAQLCKGKDVGMLGVEGMRNEVGSATRVADGVCNGGPPPVKKVILTDLHKAGENAAHASSSVVVEISQGVSTSAASAPHAGRWSSTTASSASSSSFDSQASQQLRQQQQSRLEQVGEEEAHRSGPSTGRASAPSTPTDKVVVKAAEVWPTSAAQLLESAEEVTVVPAVTSSTEDALPLMTLSAAEHAMTSESGEGVFQAEAAGAVVESANTKTHGEKYVHYHDDGVISADALLHGHSLLQLPEKDLSALEGGREKHPQPGSSFSAQFFADHTPSLLPASSSMPQPSQHQHTDDAQGAALGTEVSFDEDGADVRRLPATPESDCEERVQHVSGADADDIAGPVIASHASCLLASVEQQRWINQAPPFCHVAIPAGEEVAATTATARSATAFTPFHSPPPASPADLQAAPRVGDAQGTSYPTSDPSPCAAAVGLQHYSAATPFTNFLKAYAVFVLGTHGATSRGESKQLCNGTAPHMNECVARAGEASRGVAELASILDFYRERPLARIMEATAIQRRCRAAWNAVIVSTPASAAAQAVSDLQVCKLKASASTTAFTELCVDELVSLLAIVHHPSPRQDG
ncbi:hypothetical protein, conserved [Leishmania donovani]|uniref:Uncharacterized protein n=1 Tax=Leishmania donovani TaxID=5661 RepID=E9BAR2_LEIDO|nr:hypothetical protein, conserved [Leishmania donovani]CBZ32337.1 hypothetical protein, conserved [Leishmania donovani]